MTRKTTKDFRPEVLDLFDKYVHGLLSRRGFLNSATKYAAGAVTAELLVVEQRTVAFFNQHLRNSIS